MKRITTELELSSGQQATTVVTLDHILVRIDDRACLAHQRLVRPGGGCGDDPIA